MKFLFTIIAIAFVSLCAFAQNNINETMNHDGQTRSYIVHTPTNYDGSTPLPLVFVLHGLSDTANGIMSGVGFNTLADQENFLVVYPDGLESFIGTAWNNGTPIPNFTHDDVGFISNLIDYMIANYAADASRVYACGFSMGGIMSHRLGCQLDGKLAAIASMAGVMSVADESSCNPDNPVPVLHMHGDADGTVPYNGNAILGLSSVTATINRWSSINNCNMPTTTNIPDIASDGYTITEDHYNMCDNNSEIYLYMIANAGHIWLGPNNDMTTTLRFWNFFKEHTNENVSSNTNLIDVSNVKISPNPSKDFIHINGNTKAVSFKIFDNIGREVMNGAFQNEMNISSLSSGNYILSLQSNEGIEILKFNKL